MLVGGAARPGAGQDIGDRMKLHRHVVRLDDLLASVDVALTDEILDRIDEIVPPGTDVGAPDQSAYLPPALQRPDLHRRPVSERTAA